MVCMGFCSDFAGIATARAFLGVAEAGLFPGVVFLLSTYYPRAMTQGRIAVFFGAATVAGAFSSVSSLVQQIPSVLIFFFRSGLLAFGIGHVTTQVGNLKTTGAWRWIFVRLNSLLRPSIESLKLPLIRLLRVQLPWQPVFLPTSSLSSHRKLLSPLTTTRRLGSSTRNSSILDQPERTRA